MTDNILIIQAVETATCIVKCKTKSWINTSLTATRTL